MNLPRLMPLVALLVLLLPSVGAQSYRWTTLAGSRGGVGFRDGPAEIANFNTPRAVAADAAGNLYVADTVNHTIRRISADGMVTTLAGEPGVPGTADGVGGAARFRSPGGVAVDAVGNVLVADSGNHAIRRIAADGTVTTVAGEPGVSGRVNATGRDARFIFPNGIAALPNGDLAVAETFSHAIRRISPDGAVSTLAGNPGTAGSTDGPAADARFSGPRGIAADTDGTIYVADTGNSSIRKIDPAGNVTTLAGLAKQSAHVDGAGSAARFATPGGIAVDAAHWIYVAEASGQTIRRVDPATGETITLAGKPMEAGATDGLGSDAGFSEPWGLAVANDGGIVVADSKNHAIRKVTPAGLVSSITRPAVLERGSADGDGTDARFSSPNDLAVADSGEIYVADTGNHIVRIISPLGVVSTLAGAAGSSGTADGAGSVARFTLPIAIAAGGDEFIYVADQPAPEAGSIRKITPDGTVTTIAPPVGLPEDQSLNFLTGIAADSSGTVFATDRTGVRKIAPSGAVTYLAGRKRAIVHTGEDTVTFWKIGHDDGPGASATFSHPSGIAIGEAGNLFLSESGGSLIRQVTPSGLTSTVAGTYSSSGSAAFHRDGTGSAAGFSNPEGIAADAAGNLYVADTGSHSVRKISPGGVVTTIGGLPGFSGAADGTGAQALFKSPLGIAANANGVLYVADTGNHRIVMGTPQEVPEIVVELPDGTHLQPGGGLDFGSVAPGATGDFQSLKIRNTGNAPLEISGISLAGGDAADFALDASGLAASVTPGGFGTLRVALKPTGLGPKRASLIFSSNDVDEGTVEISLTGMGNTAPVFRGYSASTPWNTAVEISQAKLLAAASDADGDALAVTAVAWKTASSTPLTLLPTAIRVVPRSTFPGGTLVFLATITDSRGGSTTGEVSVSVGNSPATGGLSTTNPPKIELLPGGKAAISFHGIPGRTYRIQRSTDLRNWADLADAVADPLGNVTHTADASSLPQAYFRIAIPPGP